MPFHVAGVRHSSVAFLLTALAALLAPPHSACQDEAVRRDCEMLRNAMYNSEPVRVLELLYEQALQCLNQTELPACTRAFWGSRIEYLLARGYQAAGEKHRAVSHYEKGLAWIERVPENEASSESWQMRSEHLSQLCLLKGIAFLLANSRKITRYAAQALRLDPSNAAAQIIIASSKVYPPAAFGGNPAVGIELLQKSLALGTAEQDDLFNIYSGLGVAYGKLKNCEEARRWLERALKLYPGNSFVRREYEKLAT